MITPGLKDQVLRYLLDNHPLEHTAKVNLPDLLGEVKVDFDVLESVLSILADDNYVNLYSCTSDGLVLVISPAAHGFIFESGGYSRRARASELEIRNMTLNVEYLEFQLNQLQREIEDIRPTLPEKAERLLNFLANIATVLGVALKA